MDYLKITRTHAQLGARTTPAKIKIHSPKPQLRIKQKPPEMVVTRQPARVIIDNGRAFAQRGNKTIFMLTEEFAKWASDICAEAIARIAAEGTEIARAGKNRGEIIRQIILNKMCGNKISVNVEPAQGPDIRWEEGCLEINWIIHPPEIEWDVSGRVEIEVEPGSIEFYVRKYPSLKIEVVRKDTKQKINRKI